MLFTTLILLKLLPEILSLSLFLTRTTQLLMSTYLQKKNLGFVFKTKFIIFSQSVNFCRPLFFKLLNKSQELEFTLLINYFKLALALIGNTAVADFDFTLWAIYYSKGYWRSHPKSGNNRCVM